MDYTLFAPDLYLQIVLKAVVIATVSLIAMLAGQVFRSAKATIIASLLLLVLMNGTVGPFSLADHAAVPLVLSAAGVICAGGHPDGRRPAGCDMTGQGNVESKQYLAIAYR